MTGLSHVLLVCLSEARFPFKRNRLRCVNENRKKRKRLRWQAANVKFSRNKRKRQPIGMLGRSRGNHRCNKRLQRLLKFFSKLVYYFVNVYYLNKHHMK